MNNQEILAHLPYRKPFLFVDEIIESSINGVRGVYTFQEDEFFYLGHFPERPITPGVILTECMAQIGLVCLAVILLQGSEDKYLPVLTESKIEFLSPVFPKETVEVVSTIKYFRFNKLKCNVYCKNHLTGKDVARGEIAGFLTKI